LRFDERNAKETIHIDSRLLPHYFDLLARFSNNTVAINEIILKACIDAGIDVPPDLLKQPWSKK
jgi:hypothetical protein